MYTFGDAGTLISKMINLHICLQDDPFQLLICNLKSVKKKINMTTNQLIVNMISDADTGTDDFLVELKHLQNRIDKWQLLKRFYLQFRKKRLGG